MDVGGKVEMNIIFTSTITPDDLKRHSLIFSYLEARVTSVDGAGHGVQLYTDISAEWVAGDHGSVAQWDYGTTSDNVAYHKVYRQTQLEFSETSDQADWGNWYYSTQNSANLAYQSGSDATVRGQFESTGKLENAEDTNFRPINKQYPVFGFSSGFGTVQRETHSTLYTICLMQERAIQFAGATGIAQLPSLWTSYFPIETDAVGSFYNDYSEASRTARGLDNKIQRDSIAAEGQAYSTATTLAARQHLAPPSSSAIPPGSWLKLLLDPLFENQESGQYPNKGSKTRATSLVTTKSSIDGLNTSSTKLSSPPTKSPPMISPARLPTRQTSLSKAHIGIESMAIIANITGNTAAGEYYTNIAHSYITQWQTLGVAQDAHPPHTTLGYGLNDTHGLLYNLYGDKELALNLVPQSVYDMQSNFYPTIVEAYGVPLDTRHEYTKNDWEMFTATVSSARTKAMFIERIAEWIKETPTNLPMTDLHDVPTGNWPIGWGHFAARPVVGGFYAPFALSGATSPTFE
ncbi:hypothetical protein BJ875DRAFT_482256 [Amylocarpus encephaloides]|uniref:Glutaminase n=1 Tax=Amylocarpus encephaloides TaxID=45428 RepID=A0A9P8C8T7_9HELO|nr:hypothetical protein BJ875DRAFT_482256 [Amylocarpus encephaloides]